MLRISFHFLVVAIIGFVAAGSGPLKPFGTRVWAATDSSNNTASTPAIVVGGYAIVGTRGDHQIIGKRIDQPSNPGYPPMADWEVVLDARPNALAAISNTSVAIVTNDTIGGYAITGTPLWNYTIQSSFSFLSNGNIPVTLIVSEKHGLVFLGSQPSNDDVVPAPIVAVDITTGALRWEQNSTLGATNSIMALRGDFLYAASAAISFALLKLDAATGVIVWNVSIPQAANIVVALDSAPEIVIVYDTDGHITFYNSTNGEKSSIKPPEIKEGDGEYPPIFADGLLYFIGGHYLSAIDTKTWKVKWDHKMVSSPSTMLIGRHGLAFACSDGHLDAVNISNGKPDTILTPTVNGNNDNTCRGMVEVSERAIVVAWDALYLLDVPTKRVLFVDVLWASGPPIYVPDMWNGLIVVPNSDSIPGWPIEAIRGYSVLPSSMTWLTLTDFLVLHQQLDNVTNQIVYGMDTDRFYAFNVQDGSANWTIPNRIGVFYMDVGMPMTVNALCSAYEEGTTCVSRFTGETIGQIPFGTGTLMPLRVLQNRYVAVSNQDGAALIDTTKYGGTIMQKIPMSQIDGGSLSHMDVVDENHISIFLNSMGQMMFVKLEIGDNNSYPVWTFNTSGQAAFTCPPVAVGPDLIVTGDVKNKLYALNRTTGALIWTQSALNTPCSRVVPVLTKSNSSSHGRVPVPAGLALFLTTPSAVYQIDIQTGDIMWTSQVQSSEDMVSRVIMFNELLIVSGSAGLWAFNTSAKGALAWSAAVDVMDYVLYDHGLAVLTSSSVIYFNVESGIELARTALGASSGGKIIFAEPPQGYDGQAQRGPLLVISSCQPNKINVVYGISILPCIFAKDWKLACTGRG